MHLDTLRQADCWIECYLQWCRFWGDFLGDVSYVDGRRRFMHERLRKSRLSFWRFVSQGRGTLFTYLNPTLTADGSLSRVNNPLKAGFWWCYMHAESPEPARGSSVRCR